MLWGCAFEDFLTRHLEDGRNIVAGQQRARPAWGVTSWTLGIYSVW